MSVEAIPVAEQVQRHPTNPILAPAQLQPSAPDMEVVGVFNAGATRLGDEVILLARVAERPVSSDPGVVGIPMLERQGADAPRLSVRWVPRASPDLNLDDPRGIVYQGQSYLSTVSHLRLARSGDGVHFTVDPHPTLLPQDDYELYGLEDPRISLVEGAYYVTYTSPSPWGITVSLLRTQDFTRFERLGVILPPENKDVAIFPGRVRDGLFALLHRPTAPTFGRPDMWVAYSPDLRHWGEHRWALGVRPGRWDGGRIGAGAVPLRTEQGWLEIYHGAVGRRYCLGTALFDLENPHRLLARSAEPIMSPVAPYEREGFFGSVVFTCGAVDFPDGRVLVYYGAGDSTLGVAETTIDALLGSLEPLRSVA